MSVFNVTNATQLQSAIAQAVGGDKIVLAAGNYGSVDIYLKNYASNVTIQAATPDSVHFDGLKVSSSKNLTFSGIDIGRPLAAGEETNTVYMSYISNSSTVKLDSMHFHGSMDNNPGNDGTGIMVRGSTDVAISNSKFEQLFRGVAVMQSERVAIQSNEITDMRSDGVVATAVNGIVIDSNRMYEFKPEVPDHADFIQFWNTGQTQGCSNITITNNVMTQNYFSGVATTGVQGIFISDPFEYGFQNILIQNNLIWSNEQYNGITVNGATGLTVIDNTVLSKSNDQMQFWIRLENDIGVNLQRNITDNILVKNVTNLFQLDNINFAVTPGDRTLVPNLNAPAGPADLLVNGVGYHAPVMAQQGPVSSAMGSSLANLLAKANGASSSNAALDETNSATHALKSSLLESPTLDLSSLNSVPQTPQYLAAPTPAIAEPVHMAVQGSFHTYINHMMLESFVALP